jgi:hypothetical protein
VTTYVLVLPGAGMPARLEPVIFQLQPTANHDSTSSVDNNLVLHVYMYIREGGPEV